MMNVDIYTGGMAQTNSYLLTTDTATILFDAPEGVAQWVENKGVTVTHICLTHQHWDHSHDLSYFQNAELIAFTDYSDELTIQKRFRETYNMPLEVKPYTVNKKVSHEETFSIGGLQFKALHVPGHSTDSIAFYIESENLCVSGDVVMYNSTGRIDLPGGDGSQLKDSIANVLLKLPDTTILCPGHGPSSSVEDEKEKNEYYLVL